MWGGNMFDKKVSTTGSAATSLDEVGKKGMSKGLFSTAFGLAGKAVKGLACAGVFVAVEQSVEKAIEQSADVDIDFKNLLSMKSPIVQRNENIVRTSLQPDRMTPLDNDLHVDDNVDLKSDESLDVIDEL